MKFKKRGAIYSVIALMLCVAVYLNWNYNKAENAEVNGDGVDSGSIIGQSLLVDGEGNLTGEEVNGDDDTSDYFASARLSRQRARDEAVTIFNATIANESATEDSKQQASESISKMASSAVSEAKIENLIIAKGYEDCVVFLNDDSANVIIAKLQDGLQSDDIAKIKDIVVSETKLSPESIKIIESD